MPTIRRSLAAARAEARVDSERLRATGDAALAQQIAPAAKLASPGRSILQPCAAASA